MKEQIDQYVAENPLTQKEILFEGPGYKVVLVPEDFFDSQPREFVDDHESASHSKTCDAHTPRHIDDPQWVCTRKLGHPGPHVAGYDTNRILQVW